MGRIPFRRKGWTMNINCELDAVKEFREWQPTFINTFSWAISFSRGCSGGAGGGVRWGGQWCMFGLEFFPRLLLWSNLGWNPFQNYYCDRIWFTFFSFCLLVLKYFKSKFLDFHRLDFIRCNFFDELLFFSNYKY